MSKKKKSFRPKARVPKGLRDERGPQIAAQRRMLDTIQGVYERYGFEPLETSAFEYADAIGKFLPDQDRPNEGVFSFEDDDGQWLSMRYDLTAPLARFVAENYDALPKPFRRYQSGPVWRNEKVGPGRFRQFLQFDADTVATPTMAADAELIAMMAECMEELGIERGDYVVRVNNRKVLDGVLEAVGVSAENPEFEKQRLTVLRAIDKLDRLGAEGVQYLLGKGRKDESGDFTEGAGLTEDQIAKVMAFTQAGDPDRAKACDNMLATTGGSEIGAEGIAELREIDALLNALGVTSEQAIFDPSVVRGLGYYTGPVFEVELTFEAENEDGQVTRFGSVGSGGRYDGLVKMFKGVEVPATGCSFGISRLFAALEHLGKIETQQAEGPVIVLVMDRERLVDYQTMVKQLRDAGIRSEMYLGGAGMKAQMKYADKRRASVVVIEGEDERANGKITLKDLILGEKLAKEITDNEEWRSGQAAQQEVAREDLVKTVQSILAGYEG
jgi:histidyl-tRNA synthetase